MPSPTDNPMRAPKPPIWAHDMAVPSAISPQLCPTTRFCVRGCFFFPVYVCDVYVCEQITSFRSHFHRGIFSE